MRIGWTVAVATIVGAVIMAGCSRSAAVDSYAARTPQVRVTIAGGCPGTLGRAVDLRNPQPDAHHLVPDRGAPGSGLVCRYTAGPSAGSTVLVRPARLARAAAGALAATLVQVSLKPPHGSFSCPAAFAGQITIIVLGYPAGDVDLWYDTSGCQTVDNGRVQAFQGANPSFYDGFETTFDRLVPRS